MAKTNAQRQAAYRARHLKDETSTDERISMLVDLHSKRALERLALHYKVTQRAMLQMLIDNAQRTLLDTLTSSEQVIYYDATRSNLVTK